RGPEAVLVGGARGTGRAEPAVRGDVVGLAPVGPQLARRGPPLLDPRDPDAPAPARGVRRPDPRRLGLARPRPARDIATDRGRRETLRSAAVDVGCANDRARGAGRRAGWSRRSR